MKEEMKHRFAVKDLLLLPQLKGAVLLGGRSGLEQTISRINVMEVPDVVNWVKPGEFLMTTGYPFRDEPGVMEPLIANLAQRGVVALGVKTRRFLDAVPDTAVKAADFHGLPLIELPPNTTFSDVVREVIERVLVGESRHLSILQSRVQRLSQVLLHGDGLPAFLHHLQLLVNNPVVLLDTDNRWTASPAAELLCREVDEAGWRKLREDRTLDTGVIQAGERSIRVYTASVLNGQSQPFLLLMLEYENEYALVDTLTLNWAAELAGFELSNAQARQNIEAKYVDLFLQDWISGRMISPVDVRLRADACGCPLTEGARYVVGVVSFHDRRPGVDELRETARRLNRDGAAGKYDVKWTVLEEELVALLTLPNSETGEQLPLGKDGPGTFWSVVRSLVHERRATLCWGRPAAGQSGVHASYREARRAAEVSRVCNMHEDAVHYGSLGVYLLLYRLQGTDELEEFKRNYLQPLLDYDSKHQGSLLATLRMYFQCSGNAKETAERLFLHYNTVNYRLERLRSELGLRLDDPETRLQLQLAIKLSEIKEL